MNKEMLISYARALLATTITAIFAVGKLPTDFTEAEWLAVANSVWIAVIPVVIRWLNSNDAAFGRTKK